MPGAPGFAAAADAGAAAFARRPPRRRRRQRRHKLPPIPRPTPTAPRDAGYRLQVVASVLRPVCGGPRRRPPENFPARQHRRPAALGIGGRVAAAQRRPCAAAAAAQPESYLQGFAPACATQPRGRHWDIEMRTRISVFRVFRRTNRACAAPRSAAPAAGPRAAAKLCGANNTRRPKLRGGVCTWMGGSEQHDEGLRRRSHAHRPCFHPQVWPRLRGEATEASPLRRGPQRLHAVQASLLAPRGPTLPHPASTLRLGGGCIFWFVCGTHKQ